MNEFTVDLGRAKVKGKSAFDLGKGGLPISGDMAYAIDECGVSIDDFLIAWRDGVIKCAPGYVHSVIAAYTRHRY